MAEDRTSEFLSIARGLPDNGGWQQQQQQQGMSITTGTSGSGRYGSNQKDSQLNSTTKNNPAYAQLKDFHTTAGGISRDIAATSAMLGELTQLVRQKSLFVDDSQKVNGLVVRIKSSIENLNGRLDDAGAQIARQKRQLGKNSQAGQEASNLVGQLKEEFVQATAGFKKVLQQRTDTLKETSDRKREVYGSGKDDPTVSLENKPPVYEQSTGGASFGGSLSAPNSIGAAGFPTLDLTSGMTTGEPSSSGSHLPRPHGAGSPGMRLRKMNTDPIPDLPTYSGTASSYYGRQDSTPLTPWDIKRMEQESGQDQMMQLIPDQDYLRERADAMEQVETNIVELGTIFNKLAVMVSEHRDMVQRVEDNVDDTNSTINMSLATLTDTLTNLQTNRALFLKVFSILVVFIVTFIIFFA